MLAGLVIVALAATAAYVLFRATPEGPSHGGAAGPGGAGYDESGPAADAAGARSARAGGVTQGVTEAAAAGEPARARTPHKLIDGIEYVETRTAAGQVVWVPVAPEPETFATQPEPPPQGPLTAPE